MNIAIHTKNTVRLREIRESPPSWGNRIFISTSCHIVTFVVTFSFSLRISLLSPSTFYFEKFQNYGEV